MSNSLELLIALPQLVAPPFKRSVVLVLRQPPHGVLGLVLNQGSHFNLGEFSHSQQLLCHRALEKNPVFIGGPVEPYRGFILHQSPLLSERQELMPDLYISNSQASLRSCLEQGIAPFRFFLGYAGWGSHQLDEELKQSSWLSLPFDFKYLFYEPYEDLWDAIFHDMGINPATLVPGAGLH